MPEADASWIVAGLAALVAFVSALAARHRKRRAEALERQLESLRVRARDAQQRAADQQEWVRQLETSVGRLQRSIVQLPEIAQRLSASRNLREIPDLALDLVEEIFHPRSSVFFRARRDELVALVCRGATFFTPGARVRRGEGVVGWTAVKQLPMTPEDVQQETEVVRRRNIAPHTVGDFSLCVPVVDGHSTMGVILVGRSDESFPHVHEVGRTIAMLTAVTIRSSLVLREQTLLAERDGLTGLLNKRHILRSLEEMVASTDPPPDVISVFLFDIDHFKNYNDTNGHLPGDELLRRLGALLREHIREDELVGRYGGEEFLMVMPNVEKREALLAAERIRRLVSGTDFPHKESQEKGCITISGGIASWPRDADTVPDLLRHADEALYHAKRTGRDRVAAYEVPELGQPLDLDEKEGET